MDDIFEFIAVKKFQTNLLLRSIVSELNLSGCDNENLYISILPPVEGLYLIEFADYLPVTRYSDIDYFKFLLPVSRSFNVTCYLYKNEQTLKSMYKKYLKGKFEKEYKGENALEKGLKFDLILDADEIMAHVRKVWNNEYSENDKRPVIYQLVKDRIILDPPVELNYADFYVK